MIASAFLHLANRVIIASTLAQRKFLRIEQIPQRQTERLGQQVHVVDGDVPLSAFDFADVVAVQAGFESQRFLGQAAQQPGAAKVAGEDFAVGEGLGCFCHRARSIPCPPDSIHPF